ncbi:hypothetical protein SCLCIDRAFT_30463 [Scleroderma citrinum Foug A]|uniref:Uncharacterized protein n=1 Tax=Scleroderma citrinum Foug A TaxID=1036808 RepID=A0A0C2Z0E8_9AGAM|nr:hypothetical protein SCLCIDRAFT_30463 [Scleroderma citrinum Foug A]
MVFNIASTLPLNPGLEGLHVDWIVLACSSFDFDSAMSVPGSNDPMATFGVVCGWLHGVLVS